MKAENAGGFHSVKSNTFFKTVCSFAIPATLQSMLQSSFSIVDQIMIGQLGSISIAGVGLASKFTSIFSVIVSAVGAIAGIMASQYLGQKNNTAVKRSFYINVLISSGIAVIFTLICLLFPYNIMGLYTLDSHTQQTAAEYLVIIAGTFVPLAGSTMLAVLFRCIEKPRLPLYASLVSALVNTVLNYVLIFGKLGFPVLGVQGAAVATVIAQLANLLMMLLMYEKHSVMLSIPQDLPAAPYNIDWKQYISMLLPILICEVAWSLGENVYAGIYGHMGTDQSAAMTLINPIQGIMTGALCGLSQAASVIIGKKLGNGEYDEAYAASRKLICYGAVCSAILSIIIVLTRGLYVEIYHVENTVKELTQGILLSYAIVAPFKVLNMILGGGIIRSGGKTKYVMFIDLIGTWCFGVPLGLLSAFVLKLSIPYVYFMLSLEECIRFCISLVVFRRRSWIHRLDPASSS